MNNKRLKKRGKFTFVTFSQSVYLTINFYFANDLITSASSCAFGFLFSFIPIVMMIASILIRFLNISPEMISSIIEAAPILESFFTVEYQKIFETVNSIHTVTSFEIILAVTIVWMARRFFSSVLGSLAKIFRGEFKSRPVMQQFFIFAGEAVFVILLAVAIFMLITVRTLFQFGSFSFHQGIPFLDSLIGHISSSFIPFFILFLIIFVCYKFGTHTKTSVFFSALMAFGCTIVFAGVYFVMKVFSNMNNYNLIYGVLSNVIVLLLEVFFFFLIFLFFSQWLFVCEFFNTLLLAELYLLPSRENISFASSIKRILFIRPDYLLHDRTNVIHFKKGQKIYECGESGKDAFYVCAGTVQVVRDNHFSYCDRGSFFGEDSCMLNEVRHEDAVAATDVQVVRIDESEFFEILDRNKNVSQKVLSKISTYFGQNLKRFDNLI